MNVSQKAAARGGKFWARLCALPAFSFLLNGAGGVVRVKDPSGNWVELSEVQQIVDDAESCITQLEILAAENYLSHVAPAKQGVPTLENDKHKPDRELLELAAKAAGIDVGPNDFTDEIERKFCSHLGLWVRTAPDVDFGKWWAPLTNDGDALRLAVRLKMPIWFEEYAVIANQKECCGPSWRTEIGADDLGGFAATRRSIVRAAANIGKALQ